ncbi:hypothetical protein SDC9_18554 [bioreactor metagenome]|jgi:hypothetical protein|uniref:Uncharacterized protein n=1 Tax=bioreactor metagenome TaxID=1076179 RepID=A0A644U0N1_9ZZZZ
MQWYLKYMYFCNIKRKNLRINFYSQKNNLNINMKKAAIVLLGAFAIAILFESCAQKRCDAYKSTNRYRAENLR